MKRWYQSKTMIVNISLAVFAVLETQLHLLQPIAGPGLYAALAVGIPLVNVVLRTVTTTALTK
jgi:hypothetical protein